MGTESNGIMIPEAKTDREPSNMSDLERTIVMGDIARMGPDQRVAYVLALCKSLNLNPVTRPFEYITFRGKTVLYARKDCTEQLRKRDNISLTITGREMIESQDLYIVTARATTPDGRTDESTGVLWLVDPKSNQKFAGEDLANAIMKCETKAKRRVTLSICGLGFLDESEVGADRQPTAITSPPIPAIEQPKPIDSPERHTRIRRIMDAYPLVGMTPEKFAAGLMKRYGTDDLESLDDAAHIHILSGLMEAQRRATQKPVEETVLGQVMELVREQKLDANRMIARLKEKYGADSLGVLTQDQLAEVLAGLQKAKLTKDQRQ